MESFGDVVYKSNIGDGPGIRTTKDFLEKMTKNLLLNSKEYCDITEELPLCFKEKQLLPLLGSAIQKTTPAFMGEVPITRSSIFKKSKSSPGFVDFWATYRNTSFFIEVKHSFFSYFSQEINSHSIKKWETAITQLKTSAKALREGWNISQQAMLISLMVMPFYISESAVKKQKRELSPKNIDQCSASILNALVPDWYSTCYLNGKYSGPYKYLKSSEYHPAIGVYAKIIKCTE
ncbi:hypothetical protein [Solidesulfovibrio magneticus]|uniref:Uncharacterized protein n=1 Tax=Solidesulfovibrio magneticus (strain ATCC 700980 / DSM 13731 / RS-1) TaxID=573370 RepID=C4XHY1_SOLM1|nr:hypothetical protein [Solidesulfovibrio magneticus]BAH76499.1 hypothetical protein DMR_30080 [Solidesulfovibrio magneticus RS-1]